ncbi:MAG: alpha/beta hydrolase [Rubrivivax sp.]
MTAIDGRPRAGAHLRGASRLAVDATTGLTDLVEAMHARIATLPGAAPPTEGRTRGITGLVYRSVRGVTRLVGGSLDALLALLPASVEGEGSGPRREAVIAALNGVIGDHLLRSGNPLATPMSLQAHDPPAPAAAAEPATRQAPDPGRLLVLVHGLCMSERQWMRQGHHHGLALQRDLGLTPIMLRYNSGLPIADNGAELAGHLQRLVDGWPHRIERLVLLGHSMGGLLIRSAFEQGRLARQPWTERVSELVFLGTPHHGAPLERAGHWLDLVLEGTPYAGPLARIGRVRSAGITDLRQGRVVADRIDDGRATHVHVPLPAGVRCLTLAASLGRLDGDLKGRRVGDGLVPLDSALGRHADPARCLAFEAGHQWIGAQMNHLDLLSHPEVYTRLRAGLDDRPGEGGARRRPA